MTTKDNLKEAFAGESQASQKYKAFAKKAEQEGFANVAKLFRAASDAETIHAGGHLLAMEGVGGTADNLKAAIEGETYEFTTMYPPMVQQAQAEGHKGKRMMDFALKAEQVHAKLYANALEAVQQGKDLDASEIYLCPVCGNIEFRKPTEPCPICGAKAERYLKI